MTSRIAEVPLPMEIYFALTVPPSPPPPPLSTTNPLANTGSQISVQQINLVSICRSGREKEKNWKGKYLKLITSEKFILKGYFRFHSSSPGKKGSRSQWKKWGFCGKWKWNHLLGFSKHSTSFKRQEDSAAITRWVWEYFIMEWRNIWRSSCK